MTEPVPNNNEFNAAEAALRKIGSNMWFGSLNDEWQDFMVSNTVEIFDVSGRVLRNINLSSTTHYQIDLSNLQNAIYFVKISTEIGAVTKQIVKQ